MAGTTVTSTDGVTAGAWDAARRDFGDAARWFASVVADAGAGDPWARPGLGEWDVRALVGHTTRALLTVESYLALPADRVEVASTAAYYVATRAVAAGPDVAQRGRDAGAALGEDPVAAVAAVAARVPPLLDPTDGTEVVTTVAGGMRLSDYLPTRTFELVVHTLDLAAAVGLDAQPPPGPAAAAFRLVGALAAADGRAGALLLASTGRGGLPEGFTVL